MTVVNAFHSDPTGYASLIAASRQPGVEESLRTRILSVLQDARLPLPVPLLTLMTWVYSIIKEPTDPRSPSCVIDALSHRQLAARITRSNQRQITVPMFLYKSPSRLDAFRNSILVVYLSRLPDHKEYPPRHHWVAANARSAALWGRYFANTPLPDPRKPKRQWYPPIVIDRSRLQYVIPADVSCVIKDKDSKEVVFAVYRNFCGDPNILHFAKDTVEYACHTRKSVRVRLLFLFSFFVSSDALSKLEDAGRIVQIGYSGGALHNPAFGVVKNLLWKTAETDQTRRDISTLMTYFWNRAKSVLPAEVTDDMEEFYSRYQLPRLDPAWSISGEEHGLLHLPLSCGGKTYERVPLAPGCAVLAHRYAR